MLTTPDAEKYKKGVLEGWSNCGDAIVGNAILNALKVHDKTIYFDSVTKVDRFIRTLGEHGVEVVVKKSIIKVRRPGLEPGLKRVAVSCYIRFNYRRTLFQ